MGLVSQIRDVFRVGNYAKVSDWKNFFCGVLRGLVARITSGSVKSELPAAMRSLIADTAIMKQRYSSMKQWFSSHEKQAWSAFPNGSNIRCYIGQNSMEIRPADRHDIPRHEVKKVFLFRLYYSQRTSCILLLFVLTWIEAAVIF